MRTDSTAAEKTKLTTEESANLIVLVKHIAGDLASLEKNSIDEAATGESLKELPGQLEQLCADLRARVQDTSDLCEKISKAPDLSEFISELDHDAARAESVKKDLFESRERARETRWIVENLFKISSSRSKLGLVKDPLSRKMMGQAIMKTSITLERVFQAGKDLDESLERLAERNLLEELELNDAPDDGNLNRGLELAKSRPVDASATPAAETSRPTAMQGNVPRVAPADDSVNTATESEKKTEPTGARDASPEATPENEKKEKPKPELSSREFRRIRNSLNRWSQWYPLVPSRLGNKVGILAGRAENLVRVSIDVLWVERRQLTDTEPYRGGVLDERPPPDLSSLPLSPPKGYELSTQSLRLPGGECLRECETCEGKGVVSTAKRKCVTCDGAGKLRMYRVCETRFTPAHLKTIDYNGDLADELTAECEGKKEIGEAFTALKSQTLEPGLNRSCIAAAGKHVSPYFLRETLEPFYQGPENRQPGERYTFELLRSRIDIETVRTLRLNCALKDKRYPRGFEEFRVWLYGSDQRIHFEHIPKTWTHKTNGWLAALVIAGATLGYLIGLFV